MKVDSGVVLTTSTRRSTHRLEFVGAGSHGLQFFLTLMIDKLNNVALVDEESARIINGNDGNLLRYASVTRSPTD